MALPAEPTVLRVGNCQPVDGGHAIGYAGDPHPFVNTGAGNTSLGLPYSARGGTAPLGFARLHGALREPSRLTRNWSRSPPFCGCAAERSGLCEKHQPACVLAHQVDTRHDPTHLDVRDHGAEGSSGNGCRSHVWEAIGIETPRLGRAPDPTLCRTATESSACLPFRRDVIGCARE